MSHPEAFSHDHSKERSGTVASLYGLNFSPYADDQSPAWESPQPSEAQIRRRLELIAPFTRRIRIFHASGVCGTAIEVALEMGFEVVVGGWISTDHTVNLSSVEALKNWGQTPGVIALLLGNEVLDREDLPYADFAALIGEVRAACPEKCVSTALVIETLEKYPQITELLDEVYVNLHPYFADVHPRQAAAELQHQYRLVRRLVGELPIVISETGWPSPDGAEAGHFLADLIRWAGATGIPYYFFSAFDEPWKVHDEGDFGAHFGLWHNNEQLKSGYQPILYNDLSLL